MKRLIPILLLALLLAVLLISCSKTIENDPTVTETQTQTEEPEGSTTKRTPARRTTTTKATTTTTTKATTTTKRKTTTTKIADLTKAAGKTLARVDNAIKYEKTPSTKPSEETSATTTSPFQKPTTTTEEETSSGASSSFSKPTSDGSGTTVPTVTTVPGLTPGSGDSESGVIHRP